MTIRDLYPDIKPSLNLDFANTKSLDPRIDFDRSSTATYYDGQTFAKAEENLYQHSEDFTNSVWFGGSGFSFSFDSGVDAPDGSSGVYRYFEASGGNGFAEFGQLGISGPNPVRISASFSFSSESFDSVDAEIDNTSVTSLPNGWFRISATAFGYTASIHVKDAGHGQIGIDWATNNDYIRFTLNNNGNDVVQGVYIWGAQLEERSQVTAYTPTTDQPITNYIPVLKTAAPNEPRFDHDPVTGESKGLLIEEQRTNLVPDSTAFSGSGWREGNTIVEQNATVAPNGLIEAAKITGTGGSSGNNLRFYDYTATIRGNFTVSVYAKKGNYEYIKLHPFANTKTNDGAVFDLDTGTVVNNNGVTSKIEPAGNGWYRCQVTPIGSSYNTVWAISITDYTGSADADSNLQAPEGSFVFVWGAQTEYNSGGFISSHIPTSGSQVTRVADSASISGSNFSEWYRQDEGTVFVEYDHQTDRLSGDILRFLGNGGVSDNHISFRSAGGKTLLWGFIKYNGDGVLNFNNVTGINDGINKAAFAFGKNDSALSVTDYGIQEDFTVTVPKINELQVGVGSLNASNTQISNTTIKRLTYYPKRLPNAVLQTLTKD